MDQRRLIRFLNAIEKLKCNTRHSWTSSGRQESVAEHSWRLAVAAMLCGDEFPEADMEKLLKMCLIHDFGEAITGDVPSFYKTASDERDEKSAVAQLLELLPESSAGELAALFDEMEKNETIEAKLCRALDKMETLVSHNEADISTWLPIEYTENLVYGQKEVDFAEWTQRLKDEIKRDSVEKMNETKIGG